MATINLSTANASWADVAKRLDENGRIDQIIEILAEDHPLVEDMTAVEANGVTSHRTTVRAGLPTATWRLLNYGVPKSKSRTVQVTDSLGMLEAYAEIDKSLADLNGNAAAWRVSEDRAFLESMMIEMEDTLWYGNTTTAPAEFIGLAPRYALTTADSGGNIQLTGDADSGGSTSVWFVTWGPDTAHGIYPKGSKAGWQHNDLGEQTIDDGAGGQYQGYRTHYKWDLGFTLRDWRYCARLANIDVSKLQAGTYTKLIEDMILTMWKLKSIRSGLRIYCNRTVAAYLDVLAQSKTNVNLTHAEFAGRPVTMFRGIPIRISDAILNTEAAVS